MNPELAHSELLALEPITHRLPAGSDRGAIECLFKDDFVEVGASGKVYDRGHIVDTVEKRYIDGVDPDDAWEIADFLTLTLADNLCLVTYRLRFSGRQSRRSTLWRRRGSRWRAVYHQGTICEAESDR